MTICPIRTGSAIHRESRYGLRLLLIHLYLTFCALCDADILPNGSIRLPGAVDIETQFYKLCLRSEGKDFFYTFNSMNSGCYLECIYLTSDDTMSLKERFFVASRLVPIYLNGEPCGPNRSVSRETWFIDMTNLSIQFCDRGSCVRISEPNPTPTTPVTPATNKPPDFGDLHIELVSAVLNTSRSEDNDEDNSKADPFIQIEVGRERRTSRTLTDTSTPRFEEQFVFKNVSYKSEIIFWIFDQDSTFADCIGRAITSPAEVMENGWNGKKHFFSLDRGSAEGVLATVLYKPL